MRYPEYPAWLARFFQKWHLSHRTRMGRLLRKRRIAVGDYLRALNFREIEAQIARCHACDSQVRCDRALRGAANGRTRYSFCPNTPAVERYLARKA